MKLIIDINEDDYEYMKNGYVPHSFNMFYAIKNGISLDKIRTEIEQIADEEREHDEKWAIGLRYAVKIIDNYIGRK